MKLNDLLRGIHAAAQVTEAVTGDNPLEPVSNLIEETSDTLETLFSYHSPSDPERQQKHQAINDATLAYAQAIIPLISNPRERESVLRLLKTTQMAANAAITYDHLKLDLSNLPMS